MSSLTILLGLDALHGLPRDSHLLLATRAVRLFAYGTIGIFLALYLKRLGFTDTQIGLFLSLTLAGDAVLSFVVSANADHLGRRLMLVAGAILMTISGAAFATVDLFVKGAPLFWALTALGVIGVISPSGNEVGPFMPVEQSILSNSVSFEKRTSLFAYYAFLGALATAGGSFTAGWLVQFLSQGPWQIPILSAYRIVISTYAVLGIVLFALFCCVSSNVEIERGTDEERARLVDNAAAGQGSAAGAEEVVAQNGAGAAEVGAAAANVASRRPGRGFYVRPESRKIVVTMCALFALDSFGSGAVTASWVSYWLNSRFGVEEGHLGTILSTANIIAAISSLFSGAVARRLGLVNTMVFTHLPANVFVLLLPFSPNLPTASALIWLRYSMSQMDVAPRQAYIASVVAPEDRTTVLGLCNLAKTVGNCLGPLLTGVLAESGMFDAAFWVGGGVKIVYDLLIWWRLKRVSGDAR
ncbi:hypothetical protein HK097_001529 [Rhizophlyctis rosea]|uniref:Major facilitator superfamily (MFS) profile domain-containing protein n=1 Tax=Rhizophlyctis rosea TaxID=64517 RepID=A0AAD5SN65_9FUNG|nr:hypothetical protein HK097_001529 [Rhizophlyctis rosea]